MLIAFIQPLTVAPCPWDYFKESKYVVSMYIVQVCELELKEKLDIGSLMFYTFWIKKN